MAKKEKKAKKTNKPVCSKCGAPIMLLAADEFKYGCPIRACAQCRQRYLDRGWHEIAVEGYRESDVSTKSNAKQTLGLGLATLGLIAANVFSIAVLHLIVYMLIFLAIGAGIGFLVALKDTFVCATGMKKADLEQLKAESERRLSNPEYAKQLAELGYPVPSRYLI
ncbi:MAG: hypothetical protein Q4C48_03720 [Lachnospiraceae bacterium]|nr:hypothetical protein [Lachnospiraceae bacterium]